MNDKIVNNISLVELQENEFLSVRSFNVCIQSGLTSLNDLLIHYLSNKPFSGLKNCGAKSEKELVSICEKYRNFDFYDGNGNVIIPDIFVEDRFDSLSPIKLSTINSYSEYLFSRLESTRSQNALKRISERLNVRDIIIVIDDGSFDFRNLQMIGAKSVVELENYKRDLISFISFIKTIPQEKVIEEYAKILVKLNFKGLHTQIYKKIEDDFLINGSIKLFSLISFLLKNKQIFYGAELAIFCSLYQDQEENFNIDFIAKEFALSKERVRQLKVRLSSKFDKAFSFVRTFFQNDLLRYNLNSIGTCIVFDDVFSKDINAKEDVLFNSQFYSTIWAILLGNRYQLLDHYMFENSNKNLVERRTKNTYLIESSLWNSFEFCEWVTDLYLQFHSKITESYNLNFRGHLLNFLRPMKIACFSLKFWKYVKK